ncbi:MAG: biopolymer transporter ExbD [Deltaproteobacteria bacterium]|nr:biopolymer transporter ExbD [Deltaproteobacteria bacterium]
MNFRARRARPVTLLDMTPLIDVVFQLLIFFLLTSTYVQDSQRSSASVPVELPESSLSASEAPTEVVVVSIDEQGQVFMGDEQVALGDLPLQLTRAAQANPNTIVLLRGDQRVPYGRIGEVMALIRAAGLRVSAVLESGD